MVVEDALSLRMNKAKCSRSFGENVEVARLRNVMLTVIRLELQT